MFTVGGNDWRTVEIAAFTSCSSVTMSTFQLKNKLTSAELRLVVDRTVSRLGTS